MVVSYSQKAQKNTAVYVKKLRWEGGRHGGGEGGFLRR